MKLSKNRKVYPLDLTERQWELLEPLIPAIGDGAASARLYAARNGEWHPLRLAKRLPVEIGAPRFASLGHAVLVLSHLAKRRGLG